MSSLQTFFRTVVMLATLGIVAKIWFLYGPSVGELQTIGVRVVELSKEAINNYWKSPSGNTLAGDPQAAMQPAPFVPPSSPMQPIPLPPVLSPATGPVQLANSTVTGAMPTAPPLAPAGPATNAGPPKSAQLEPMGIPNAGNRLVSDVERLADLGVRDQQVKPWGSGGALFRCTCEAPWTASPNYSRHFEAVATSAEAAVEQVTAQVVAWQNSQRRTTAGQ
jgi:hypothetical protein